jgi:predicted Holliday junction resolvase-like endonuclease
MKHEMLTFFSIQRQIFGICPRTGNIFRLSDCRLYQKTAPVIAWPHIDWLDEYTAKAQRLDRLEEKLDQESDKLREKARAAGRLEAKKAVKRVDPVFTPRRLDPQDSKMLFHPLDFVVFNGLNSDNGVKSIVMLDARPADRERAQLQKTIERTIERGHYEWVTFHVDEAGRVQRED